MYQVYCYETQYNSVFPMNLNLSVARHDFILKFIKKGSVTLLVNIIILSLINIYLVVWKFLNVTYAFLYTEF